MTMTATKSLMLAVVTALSLGVSVAMAQESAGGVNAGPCETAQLNKMLAQQAAAGNPSAVAALDWTHEPQYGSSDSANKNTWPVPLPQGGDGSGG
jgi:hypothetical protein